ncbi:MAG: hypothetical protein Ta2B_00630 [Termitinemataceae bacterium]|nr:MAG: hypothetical protein Ta2B_00630 [Termitinemataceae bacterium]
MKKRFFKIGLLVFIFAARTTANVFAYDNFLAGSYHIGLLNGDLSIEYERMLTERWSFLLEAGNNHLLTVIQCGYRAMLGVRLYPWENVFYLSAKVGYEPFEITNLTSFYHGIGINPSLGWRFDPGGTDGLIIMLDLGFDLQLLFFDAFANAQDLVDETGAQISTSSSNNFAIAPIASTKLGIKIGYSW